MMAQSEYTLVCQCEQRTSSLRGCNEVCQETERDGETKVREKQKGARNEDSCGKDDG